MGVPVDEVYREGLGFFTAVVERVPGGAWDVPSPCAGWRARDVLGHVGVTTRYGTELLTGGRPDWRPAATPGSAVEGEPGAWWRSLADGARRVLAGVDLSRVVDTPAGPRSVVAGLSFPAVDLFLHGWDLGRSAGLEVEIPATAIELAHEVLDEIPPDRLRSPATFGPEVPVERDATPTSLFVAWAGRDPRWAP